MEILQIKILRGPNYWSNFRKQLIVVELDLKKYEELPSNLIEGFYESLSTLLPSMYSHQCSRNKEGGFFERIQEGTWLGHVIEHVALELQCLAGMDCGYGRTRSTGKKGVYYVVFAYELENAGIYAAKVAVKLVEALAKSKRYTNLKKDLANLKKIQSREGFGISTKAILAEARLRNIPVTTLEDPSMLMLGYGNKQRIISATLTEYTSCLGVDIASDKNLTKNLLSSSYIPVPKGVVINKLSQLEPAIDELNFPIVLKPLNANHGKGITINVNSKEQATAAFKRAQRISSSVIVEHFVQGHDFRFLVINYKLVAIGKRVPAFVIGDGSSTINELIHKKNKDPKRGDDHENILTTIKVDEATRSILREQHLNLKSVLAEGQTLYLKHAANISSGGTAIDVTSSVHPYNVILAERIARLMHIDICGIDIVAESIEAPITPKNGAVIEVNAAPGLRMHLSPSEGQSINVAKPIIDMLYPEGSESRIPIIAITGTNGKTTTARILAYFAQMAGHTVGLTSTDGIYINNAEIYRGDCSGPKSAKTILSDPVINFAVLECARGGIIRSGLGFDTCHIGILLNISEDHLGLEGIESIEELARVKSVVPHSVEENGYAILNADDDLVYAIKDDLLCNVALFSLQASNSRVLEHCENGGAAAYIEMDNIIFHNNRQKLILAKVHEIPLTYNGTSSCMLQNILAALLGGILSNFRPRDLINWLKAFNPKKVPGRMNIYEIGNIKIMLDYAHNVGAFQELEAYFSQTPCIKKIGIIGTPGDRRENDIKQLGFYSARIFDEIIIRHDDDGRGRTNQEITALLLDGIKSYSATANVLVISNETEALKKALRSSIPGSFIVYCPEKVFEAISFLNQLEASQILDKEVL